MYFHPYGYGRSFAEWLFPILLIALFVALIVVVIWSLRRPPALRGDTDPLRRAAARYAAGEIERVEFERIQRDLAPSAANPLTNAALRLARGEITTAEYDEIRSRITGQDDTA